MLRPADNVMGERYDAGLADRQVRHAMTLLVSTAMATILSPGNRDAPPHPVECR
jgi:hypothetical protein